MKLLKEVMDLYGLHKNPEELAKYDKAKDSFLVKKGRWTSLGTGADGFFCIGDNSSLPSVAAKLQIDVAWGWVRPFDPDRFKKELSGIDEQGRDHIKEFEETYRQYKKARARFIKDLSQFQPATLVYFDDESTQAGIIVLEHDPDSAKVAFSTVFRE